ncbi:MAG: hypothetical protein ACQES7_09345 [Pseudomonadota bacterium]
MIVFLPVGGSRTSALQRPVSRQQRVRARQLALGGSLLSLMALSAANAQERMELDQIDGIDKVLPQPDGSVIVVRSDGIRLQLAAEAVEINDGVVTITRNQIVDLGLVIPAGVNAADGSSGVSAMASPMNLAIGAGAIGVGAAAASSSASSDASEPRTLTLLEQVNSADSSERILRILDGYSNELAPQVQQTLEALGAQPVVGDQLLDQAAQALLDRRPESGFADQAELEAAVREIAGLSPTEEEPIEKPNEEPDDETFVSTEENETFALTSGVSDTLLLGATQAANGVDIITGFSTGLLAAGGDILEFASLDQGTLRGSGTDAETFDSASFSLGDDTGMVLFTTSVSLNPADRDPALVNLVLEMNEGDALYVLAAESEDGGAQLARVERTGTGFTESDLDAQRLAIFEELGSDGLGKMIDGNISDFQLI